MKSNSIYSSFITTKTNSLIPVLVNGKTIESKYNPEAEAQKLIALKKTGNNFYIIIGIGSGILINELHKVNPYAKIIAIENSVEDIEFLLQNPLLQKIKSENYCILSDLKSLFLNILNNYIPAFYGNIEIIEQKAWSIENVNTYENIKAIIKYSLEKVSADFSVQSHFGKIWQYNIINNLKIKQKLKLKTLKLDLPVSKTAIIVAAGPSLDSTIDLLKQNKNNYFVIATDTAYSTLLKENIYVDVVISIDGQNLSCNHFIHSYISKNTLFIFDLCANYNAVKYISKITENIIFSTSGHPLCEYIKTLFPENFIPLFSGSGTVTIAALDFAINIGFKNIQILGADFAYLNGKAYTKGTYLDILNNTKSCLIQNSETIYDKLLYRIELKEIDKGVFSTTVLESYKQSLEDYLKSKNIKFSKKESIYVIENLPQHQKLQKIDNSISLNIIKQKIVPNKNEIKTINDLSNSDISLLPLISWLRNNDNNKSSFNQILEAAYNILQRCLNDEKDF